MSLTTRHERPQPRHATNLSAPCHSSRAASRSRVSPYVLQSCRGRSTWGRKPQKQWWPHRRFGPGSRYAIFRAGCAERARAVTPEVTRRAGEAGKPRNVGRGVLSVASGSIPAACIESDGDRGGKSLACPTCPSRTCAGDGATPGCRGLSTSCQWWLARAWLQRRVLARLRHTCEGL